MRAEVGGGVGGVNSNRWQSAGMTRRRNGGEDAMRLREEKKRTFFLVET